VVVRAGEKGIDGPEDLAGRRITVRPSSPYHATLVALKEDSGIDFTIEPAPETLETETLIAGVADGTYDMTVADGHILGIELTWRDDVRGAFELGPEADIAWAVRPGDDELLGAVDAYMRRHGPRSEFFNVLHQKYFTKTQEVSRRLQERPEVSGEISPYDDLFRKYGEEFGIDWRLLAAQAFQESRFDVGARSWAGAVGLMQLMPRTARGLGVKDDLRDPEVGIRAGAMYLRRLADRHYPDLPFTERLRFALGAYNAGPGHVRDGRQIARRQGLDPDVWFDQVDQALPLLSRRDYARKARYGFCRCQEAVRYVSEIHQRYRRYVEVVQ
jgi:membrane-bound lytic murein transglycosylase F